ncbi:MULTISPECIES: hypothetical protein [unclassified Delftia]|uniref:hypothetical protein n=1 Tax=unclassified Delftia TaxID=2613839 RepID=UPI0019009F42|nr:MULTISPECIES: hypothetical protein [unclassified Delftia]MBK0113658.1 hypothetical protein [Delftia sp. S65]MBK0118657.1 hypothetical protein [Delftia sp. S67]MBK0132625.1 hypothetical protein [Delftia sp. S66]
MKEALKNRLAVLAVLAMSAPAAFAQSTTPEAAIGDAQDKILAIIAVAGLGFITVALASVGWTVGAKFIKRIGGKA